MATMHHRASMRYSPSPTSVNDSSLNPISLNENQQLVNKPPTPPKFNQPGELLQSNSFQRGNKKQKQERTLKQTLSYVDLLHPIEKQPVEFGNALQQSFKIFMIRQNVKKFIAKLLERVKLFSRFNLAHYKTLNDNASDENVITSRQQNRIVMPSLKSMKKKKTSLPGQQLIMSFWFYFWLKLEKMLQPVKEMIRWIWINIFIKYVPVIQPESLFAKIINSITIFIQGFYIIIIPVDIGFRVQNLSTTLLPINGVMQALFLVMILVNFTKATFKNGQLLDGRLDILKHYFFGGFARDFVSLMALFFSSVLQYQRQSEFLNFLMVLFYLQVVPLLESEESYSKKGLTQSKILRYSMKFMSLLFRILFAEHIFSCLFFFLSRTLKEQGFPSFLVKYELADEDFSTQYITAFYFASTTMITVGYGDLVPQNNGEKILVVIFQIISSIQLSYSVNTIGNIIQEIKTETEKNQQKTRLINEYMETKNISSQLQLQIREYLNYYWKEQEAEQHLGMQQDIVNELPEYLKSQLLKEANEHIIAECPFFKKFPFSDPLKRGLYRVIYAMNLLPESFLENEKGKQGLKGPCIYYLEKGAISSQAAIGTSHTDIELYAENEYFGFREFILGMEPTIIYKSTQFSRVFCLPLNEFIELLKDFPEDNEIYHDLKSQLEFSPMLVLSKLPQTCLACKDQTHLLTECKLIHYAPDRELVVKKHMYFHPQERNPTIERHNRFHSTFSALYDKQLIQDHAIHFEADNSKFLEALYEQPSDDYSASDSDDSSDQQTLKENAQQNNLRDNESSKTSTKKSKGLGEIKEEEETEHEHEIKPTSASNPKVSLSPLHAEPTGGGHSRSGRAKMTKTPKAGLPRKPPVPKSPQKRKQQNTQPSKYSKQQRQSIAIQQLISQSLGIETKDDKKKQIKFSTDVNQADDKHKREERLDKIYPDEKMYLTMVERHRFMYFDKMNHFLSKQDLWQLDTLHTILRVLINPTYNDNFEAGRLFNFYKPKENKDRVLDQLSFKVIRVRSKQQLDTPIGVQLYPGKKILQLIKYMLYPYYYILQFKRGLPVNLETDGGDYTDLGGSFGQKTPPYNSKKSIFSKSQVVPFQ